jgi:hypothetical protein
LKNPFHYLLAGFSPTAFATQFPNCTLAVAYPLKLKAYLLDILRREAAARQSPIQTVLIHRDGRVWPSELEGTRKAFEFLKREGTLAPDVTFTVLEISKSSPAPLRLFDVRYN